MPDRPSHEPKPYTAAPITEAVAEIRFADAKDKVFLRKLSKKLASFYPNEIIQTSRGVQVDFAGSTAQFTDAGDIFRRSSSDEVDIALIKNETISFSRLAPYTCWSDFEDRISRDIELLNVKTAKRNISRIGLRYINRIDIPFVDGVAAHERYLNV